MVQIAPGGSTATTNSDSECRASFDLPCGFWPGPCLDDLGDVEELGAAAQFAQLSLCVHFIRADNHHHDRKGSHQQQALQPPCIRFPPVVHYGIYDAETNNLPLHRPNGDAKCGPISAFFHSRVLEPASDQRFAANMLQKWLGRPGARPTLGVPPHLLGSSSSSPPAAAARSMFSFYSLFSAALPRNLGGKTKDRCVRRWTGDSGRFKEGNAFAVVPDVVTAVVQRIEHHGPQGGLAGPGGEGSSYSSFDMHLGQFTSKQGRSLLYRQLKNPRQVKNPRQPPGDDDDHGGGGGGGDDDGNVAPGQVVRFPESGVLCRVVAVSGSDMFGYEVSQAEIGGISTTSTTGTTAHALGGAGFHSSGVLFGQWNVVIVGDRALFDNIQLASASAAAVARAAPSSSSSSSSDSASPSPSPLESLVAVLSAAAAADDAAAFGGVTSPPPPLPRGACCARDVLTVLEAQMGVHAKLRDVFAPPQKAPLPTPTATTAATRAVASTGPPTAAAAAAATTTPAIITTTTAAAAATFGLRRAPPSRTLLGLEATLPVIGAAAGWHRSGGGAARKNALLRRSEDSYYNDDGSAGGAAVATAAQQQQEEETPAATERYFRACDRHDLAAKLALVQEFRGRGARAIFFDEDQCSLHHHHHPVNPGSSSSSSSSSSSGGGSGGDDGSRPAPRFFLRPTDIVYPVCHEGQNRSQVLHVLLQGVMRLLGAPPEHVQAPHGACGGCAVVVVGVVVVVVVVVVFAVVVVVVVVVVALTD